MDTLTHALSGALVARATAGKGAAAPNRLSVRARVAVGFLAAAFPDTDVVLTWVSPITYITQHRGLTHSWIMLPVWAALLAWLFSRLARDKRGWKPYLGVCALAIGIHIIGDWITSFGTMMLAPLSDHRFALGTTFIIDLIFTGLIVAALLGSVAWHRSRVPAMAGLVLLAGYIGFQWTQQQKALEVGTRYAQSQGLSHYRVAALPRAVSPFNWTVIITAGERYHRAHVNLMRGYTPPPPQPSDGFLKGLSAGFRALHDVQWEVNELFGNASEAERPVARAAWTDPAFAFYRWFAAFPVLDRVTQGNPETCAWFHDQRFDMPGRTTFLFHYGLCRSEGSMQWRVYKLNEDGSKTPV